MSNFEERQRGEEAKFAHDAQLRFRAEARRNKHLAHWASAELGVTEPDAIANYVAEVIAADMTESGHENVVRKIKADFNAGSVATGEAEIRAKISEFEAQARQEILAEG